MTQEVTESLLEMHYHRAFVKLFEDFFGRRVLRIIKPSTRSEAFLGFDQAWVKTPLPLNTFTAELRRAINTGATSLGGQSFLGYFMQFKRVDRMAKGSRKLPPSIRAPYLRAEIDLRRNKQTGRSQHETLTRLNAIIGADVHYACPMLLDADQIYDEPDLDTLRLVPVASAPTGFNTNESHHIVFQDENSPDWFWCSEPQAATVLRPLQWLQQAPTLLLNGAQLAERLEKIRAFIAAEREPRTWLGETPAIPTSFTVIELA